jgi:hypothetical protein
MNNPVWTEPRIPGAGYAVRETRMRCADEVGNVRIQHYGPNVCVAAFLPGWESSFPGDTPKMNPDDSEWFAAEDVDAANAQFDKYVAEAKANGWKEE